MYGYIVILFVDAHVATDAADCAIDTIRTIPLLSLELLKLGSKRLSPDLKHSATKRDVTVLLPASFRAFSLSTNEQGSCRLRRLNPFLF